MYFTVARNNLLFNFNFNLVSISCVIFHPDWILKCALPYLSHLGMWHISALIMLACINVSKGEWQFEDVMGVQEKVPFHCHLMSV